ncbi:MAG: energy-coupling factor transporter transmembrane protein EcfT [Armatimonadetes bacterium]|nr:energy-coupling factor transporter transmembrane protein EcfT [Armatimonadota bacterium]
MSVFLYVDRESPLHRLHPVTKIVGLVLGFAIALMFSHPLPAAGALLLSLIALGAAGGLGNLRRSWKFLVVLFVMTTLIWSVFLRLGGPLGKGGAAPWVLKTPLPQVMVGSKPLGGGELVLIEASPVTVGYGVAMALRIVACLVFGLAFLSSTRTEDFALGLRTLGAPQGVSVAVSLGFRLVPTLAGTARNVIEAQRARGVDPAAGGLFRRIRRHVPLIVPVLAYALRGADMTAMALESRGLGADPTRRTQLREFHAGAADALALAAMAGLVVAGLMARLAGLGIIGFG